MSKHTHDDRPDDRAPGPSRQARLQALLFAGAALSTTLVMLGSKVEPKLPPFYGE